MKARLDLLQRRAFEELVQSLEDQAEVVLSRSRDLAPQLTGAMIAHSRVVTERLPGVQLVRVVIVYDEPYADKQHEGYYYPGPVTREKLGDTFAIGRKFLTKALDERREVIAQECGKRLERALRLTLR